MNDNMAFYIYSYIYETCGEYISVISTTNLLTTLNILGGSR